MCQGWLLFYPQHFRGNYSGREWRMEITIFRTACVVYLLSLSITVFLAFNPDTDVAPEILSYMRWWYSQPGTPLESFVSLLDLAAIIISVISTIVLLFLQKWAGYLFSLCILILVATEWLVADYIPQSGLESNMDTVVSISTGFILCGIVFSEKLGIFKR